MTSKPETVIQQVSKLSENHSISLLQFYDWLIENEEGTMLSNTANYLRGENHTLAIYGIAALPKLPTFKPL